MSEFNKKEKILLIIVLILSIRVPYIFLLIVGCLIYKEIKIQKYKKTEYYKQTKNLYRKVDSDIGLRGEYLIYKYLKKYETFGAKFLFNVYLPKEDGTKTEIDVMMISSKGVFVFESKNYSGWIFGKENDNYWYQTLPAGRGISHKEKFYNPIKQNESHIKILKQILKHDVKVESMIVFSERCEFKDLTVDYNKINLIYRFELPKIFEKIYSEYDSISLVDVEKIYNDLYQYTQINEEDKQKHIDTIKENKNRCPRCNGKLIERTARKGNNAGKTFYGCSNYPRCKYTRDID